MNISKKKIFKFLKSMKFGLILLGILCLVAIIGSVVPQGRQEAFYLNTYSPLLAQLIISFKFNDIYHSSGFILLFIALSFNLILCSTVKLKNIIQKIKKFQLPPNQQQLKNPIYTTKYSSDAKIQHIFTNKGFNNINRISNSSEEIYFSNKNRIGYLGSWLIHIGILAIIICYSYGQYTFWSGSVYGVSGSSQKIEGTNYIMNINDFNIIYRDDGSVQQYITKATLKDKNGNELLSDEIYVNKPMRYEGYTLYQHSTGWAAKINIFKDDKSIGNEFIYDGTAYTNNEEFIIMQINHIYPDFVATKSGFGSKSNELNNPKILYSIFYGGQVVDMNIVSPNEDIHWQNFRFKFNTPEQYTYLSINKMNGKIGAIISSVILMTGLFLTFYLKPKQLIVKRKNDNIYVYGDYSFSSKNIFKSSYGSSNNLSI